MLRIELLAVGFWGAEMGAKMVPSMTAEMKLRWSQDGDSAEGYVKNFDGSYNGSYVIEATLEALMEAMMEA